MATVNLQAKSRTERGKGTARKLRAADSFPAVLYGLQQDPRMLSIDAAEFRRAISTSAGRRAVLRLAIDDDSDPTMAILKEVQRHPVSRVVLHVDLLAIDLNVPIEVAVPVHAIGTPTGVKNEGGILGWSHRAVRVRVLPTAIPEHIDVDVSELHVGQSVHVGQIVADGFEILDDEDLTICSVSTTRLMEVAEVPTEGEEEAVAEETEGEGEQTKTESDTE